MATVKQGRGGKEIAVLAYSGGLDTSVAIRWIMEKYSADVITVSVDVGQKEDLREAADRAVENGAIDAIVVDARKEFASSYLSSAIRSNALYEGRYPLSTALARPLIASKVAAVARSYGAKYVAHGCTGKGNDQVRFELAFTALDPSLRVIAPIREWNMNREDEVAFAQERGIKLKKSQPSRFSTDENLWGRSIEGGELEDPWTPPPEEIYEWTSHPSEWPDRDEMLDISFDSGIPVEIDGKRMPLDELVMELNLRAGRHGVGRIDHVEDRFVGIKSRENYECPAASVILPAHRALEGITLSRDILLFKPLLEQKFSELVYNGMWFSDLRNAVAAFVDETQRNVTGKVRVRLYKGAATVCGVYSERSKYTASLSTYGRGDTFDQRAAQGFIYIAGLHLRGTASAELEKIEVKKRSLERKVQKEA
ncbi:MAG: argininosuccinate synthase [Thermoplasmata archaeon]|uniref:Argininosuccinate synthase n=1 Tax=Candidatus Sysuiplasma superficiale TaxID=2823368 RepID=A0A8J7YIX2_9ARCH|nr:argininosuccinate synthase [Candidatus Sysuiplasma superficiale]MBX8643805.1 argininosuccinate synthase [Candidatus Sysuiplasma superficiale]